MKRAVNPEEWTERQVLAHVRKIKMEVSRELAAMTAEEQRKFLHDEARRAEEECGFKFVYATPLSAGKMASQAPAAGV